MRSYIEFLTTPTADTQGTTLLLHFDRKRYLIGSIAEGTQRACVQRGIKLTKVSDIFLTGRTEWANTGGLIGMILTLADVVGTQTEGTIQNVREKAERLLKRQRKANGDEQVERKPEEPVAAVERPTLTLHGGGNLTHTLATGRRFVFRKGMAVEVDEHEERDSQAKANSGDRKWEPTFTDENIKVWAMEISPSRTDLGSDASHIPATSRIRRKNSSDIFDEMQTDEPTLHGPGEPTKIERHQKDSKLKTVVSEMFNSEWRLDHLAEKSLSEVLMPAAIFIRDPKTGKISEYSGPMPQEAGSSGDQNNPVNDIKVLVRQPWPGALINELPPTSPSRGALSYIIKNHPQRGKFMPEKAKALGVRMGTKWADLTMGKSVEAIDGSMVTPEMVLGEGKEGAGFAVVDLPSEEYVSGLIDREEWKSEVIMSGVGVIVWILGTGVGKNEKLKGFLAKMSHVNHIVSSPDYCPNYLAFDTSAAATIQLFQLDPARFRIPIHDNVKVPQVEGSTPEVKNEPSLFQAAERGKRVQLHPILEVQDQFVEPPLNTANVWRSASEEVLHLARNAHNELQDGETKREIAQQQEDIPGQDVEIIALGTGSSLPSKYRNVSATLVRVPGVGSYLFDCGEGTLGQLRRMFRAEEVSEVLHDLKAIWISHLHADHHLGIASVIKAWHKEVWNGRKHLRSRDDSVVESHDHLEVLQEKKRLFVLSDHAMIQWLNEYASVEDYGFDKLVPLSIHSAKPAKGISSKMNWGDVLLTFSDADGGGSRELGKALLSAMGVSDVQAVDVEHCKGSKAVSITFPNGFKFSYSGDCRPSKAFAAIGKGSTVLLHEATFDDELRGDARAKKHSTTSEALAVGVAMGAKRVLLTHFSQRYQKIPEMEAVEGQVLEIDAAGEVDVARLPPIYAEDNDSAMPDVMVSDPALIAPMETNVTKIKKSASTDMKVGVAFDFMRVKVGEIIHLERFTPALIRLYEPQEVEEESQEAKSEVQDNKQKTKKPKREAKARQIEGKLDKKQNDARGGYIAKSGRDEPQEKEKGAVIA
ncbi:hypothetical protein GP486_000543 [Trichoglossum hirsutum]|uniref:ribonuclease Z n=1 Tax=Trichoglossum hirsutum TaxID=265104 RepID=A0A9P8LHK8_9PEZI|nr:hypothetical protein GP486_000543 [Trichoglossum hirsutum]